MKVIFLLLIFIVSSYSQAAQVTDDFGQRVQLTKNADRIISLAPDITEILFSIGAGNRIVGVVSHTDYPAAAIKIPRVGSYQGLDLEKIIALRPNLVIVWGLQFYRQINVLRQLGIPVYSVHPVRLTDIPKTMRQIGALTGDSRRAEQQARLFLDQIERLKTTYQHTTPVKVFYQIGSYSLLTVNKQSWINQVIQLCGGVNPFADASVITPEVSWESVVAANPEVVISDTSARDWRVRWLTFPEISAVRNNLLFTVTADYIDRAGPRLLKGAQQICSHLQAARTQIEQHT